MSDFDNYSGNGESETRSGSNYSGVEDTNSANRMNDPLSDSDGGFSEEGKGSQKNSKVRSFGKTVISLLTTVLVVFGGRVVGRSVGNGCVSSIREGKDIADIEKFIAETENYKPGVCTDEKYVSEHFGIVFSADEDWKMLSESERNAYNANVRQSSISSVMESLKGKKISQSLKDKLEEAIYSETEMGAAYMVDGEAAGQVMITVFRAYGADESTAEDMMESLESELSQMGKVSRRTRTLAGEKYEAIEVDVVIGEGLIASSETLLRLEDGMYCMINCSTAKGMEDELMKSFEEHISAL